MKNLLCLLLLTGSISLHAQGTRLLRQPTMSETEIVFVYANDLWKSPISGGKAIRLTSNEGYESFPHFSPDGSWVAFTGQYDGNTDVFVIPASGGEPKRLTWHPGADFVRGWNSEGSAVLFGQVEIDAALIESIVLGDGGARHTATLRALVEAGADVNLPDRGGRTPLSLARSRGYDKMARILVRAGAREGR